MIRAILQPFKMALLAVSVFITSGAQCAETVMERNQLPKSIIVIGDSLADGLYSGFYRLMKRNETISVRKKTKINTGLVRYDRYNWSKTIKKIAASGKFDVAVVSFGANDLISFRGKGRPTHFGEEKWPALYAERIAEIVQFLKKSHMKVYWVGLPIVGKTNFREGYAFLNTIFRKTARENGAFYVDTWAALEVDGAFSDYGKDVNGKAILIRHTDGVHFTSDGYVTYARIVADKMMPNGWTN